jgi:hypothetical protein
MTEDSTRSSGIATHATTDASAWTGWPACIGLVLLFCALALTSAARKSPTFDEGYNVVSGYTNWLLDEYRLHSGNGILVQRLTALPLVLQGDTYRFPDPRRIIENHRVRDHNELTFFLAHVFFYESGNDREALLLQARAMNVLLGAAMIPIAYAWSRRLFGPRGGILSALLVALSPNWLAHSRLMTSDVAFTATLLASLAALWSLFARLTLWRVVGAGLLLAALANTKLSALGVIPMVVALFALRLWGRRPLVLALGREERVLTERGPQALAIGSALALQLAIVIVATWALHGFRFSTLPEGRAGGQLVDSRWEWALRDADVVRTTLGFAREHELLPEAYLYGLAFVARTEQLGQPSFLRGEVREVGSWDFHPYAVAVKTPLGVFALALLAMAAGVRALRREWPIAASASTWSESSSLRFLYDSAPLWVMLAVLWPFALTSNINLGLRHVLPSYLATFILCGGAALWLTGRRPLAAAAVGISAAGVAAASLSTWPHYLAFFNAAAGGPDAGYRHITDSSLDWGQDVDELRRWLQDQGLEDSEDTPVYLSYFGSADPLFHGVKARRLTSFYDWPSFRDQWRDVAPALELRPGTYLISATMIQRSWLADPRAWNRELEARYRAARAELEPDGRMLSDAVASEGLLGADASEREALLALRELRFMRLASYLLARREPNETIGHSILVYRLDQGDVDAAVDGVDWFE